MKSAILICVCAAGAATAKDEEVLTIVGCVQGSRLKPSPDVASDAVTDTLRASEYALDGPKALLKALTKSHDGHLEEITGMGKVQPSPGQPDVHVRTKDLGDKTRITLGNRQRTGSSVDLPMPAPARIVVQSFKHVADKCVQK